MEDGPRAIDILTRLRLKGFELSIDDFGTGYSSLVQLHRLPFCELKIDRTFVNECDTEPRRAGHRARHDRSRPQSRPAACAEGVESEAVARTLESLGCDSAQGYHFARPMAAADVPAWAGAQGRADVSTGPSASDCPAAAGP